MFTLPKHLRLLPTFCGFELHNLYSFYGIVYVIICSSFHFLSTIALSVLWLRVLISSEIVCIVDIIWWVCGAHMSELCFFCLSFGQFGIMELFDSVVLWNHSDSLVIGIIPTVWYNGIVPTYWYFGIIPTVWNWTDNLVWWNFPTVLYFGIAPTIWYFGIISTVWYNGIVPTMLYLGIVPTVWYFGIIPTVWYNGIVPTGLYVGIVPTSRYLWIVSTVWY
jgi:hypothetical protein